MLILKIATLSQLSKNQLRSRVPLLVMSKTNSSLVRVNFLLRSPLEFDTPSKTDQAFLYRRLRSEKIAPEVSDIIY